MESERRAALENRRHMAQRRLSRQEWSRDFRQLAPALCKAGVRFAKLVPQVTTRLLGTMTDAPGQDERFSWEQIEGGQRHAYATIAERDAFLARALADCALPASRVAVIFHPASAGVRLAAADIPQHAPLLFDIAPQLWLIDGQGGQWLIEIDRFDQEVCWSRTMPGTAAA